MDKRTINSVLVGKKNNLDFVRFAAAVLVIFSHSYPLSLGNNGTEPLSIFSKGQETFGGIAVATFFVVSGFLITMSFQRSKNMIHYFKARILRIFPALIFLIFITAFIFGPLISSYSITQYFTSYETFKYLKMVTLPEIITDSLPGVFESNPHVGVNGSLWTLYYEFLFYILVAIFGVLKLLNKRMILVIFSITIALYYVETPYMQHINLFRYFSAGMVLYLYRDVIVLRRSFAFLSLYIILLGCQFNFLQDVLPVFGAYIIIYLSFVKADFLEGFSKNGDFSYGLYIYAYPVQQTVTYMFNNNVTPIQNFLLSFPITLVLAYYSWHLIEKNALKLKNYTLFKPQYNKELEKAPLV